MNNIKKILEEKEISVLKLSEMIGKSYSPTHDLVNRESLNATRLETLIQVADVLDVKVDDLYTRK